uniref:Uncharacterized protein n=1 Tax=Salix viminalis TaxID=40686 RepID=A0A6N2KL42_SALVM
MSSESSEKSTNINIDLSYSLQYSPNILSRSSSSVQPRTSRNSSGCGTSWNKLCTSSSATPWTFPSLTNINGDNYMYWFLTFIVIPRGSMKGTLQQLSNEKVVIEDELKDLKRVYNFV